VKSYKDLPQITLDQVKHFFEPGKWGKVVKWGDAEEACRLILEGIERNKRSK